MASNTTQIARLEADIASLLASQPSVAKYISLNGETAQIIWESGAEDILDFTKP